MRTTQIADLYQSEGPFASVTLDISHASENAAQAHELRLRAACEQLREAGADDRAVETVAARLAEPVTEPAPVARTVVATKDGVVFDEVMHVHTDQPTVAWGPLPDLTPWIAHEDSLTPFVLAVVDHVGGDVGVYTSDVPEPDSETSAGGETDFVHKVPSGGWSQLRYQHVTENVWKENAEDVAEEIVRTVRSGPQLVILVGDPHSRSIVAEKLAGTQVEVVQLEAGSRSEDGGEEALQQAVRETLMEHTVARRLALTRTLEERVGQHRAVAVGVDEVVEAFVRGQVETLLLDPDTAARHAVVAQDHPGLSIGAVAPTEPLPAHQAFVAAAALTGADVTVGRSTTLGDNPVAALLRWDQSPTPA
jgi:hypothetical protein